MKKFNGIYLGVVVQNNDPEQRGRIKVWVPHINVNIYNEWNATKQNKKFKFPGLNINSDLSNIIDELRDELPWAEFCSPLVGESASGVYNAFYETATVSDANYTSSLSASNYTDTSPDTVLNQEKFGEKPGSVYEKYASRLTDAFTDTASNNTSKVNPHGANYRPSTYSNSAKGIFAIPNVGAHVWVFFRDGVYLYPVYIGASLGEDDFKSIFVAEDGSAQDYPGAFENVSKNLRDEDVSTSTYRNKMVVNQRGAAIEIINTTDRERFKITHFAGGFIEFNNKFNSLFSPKNFQLLTLRDKFETVKGHSNLFVSRDSDNLIKGDYFLKIGSLNIQAMKDWRSAYTNIANILAQPEGTAGKDSLANTINQQIETLAEAERKLGFGGNYIETITKHKFINVGLIFNDFASYRISNTQKMVNQFRNVTTDSTTITETGISLIEYVSLDDMPGGNYTKTIGNKYSLLVGSGGVDIKTTGPVNIGGTIMAFAGKQVNIASKYDMNIDGGTNLSVIANIVKIRSRNRDQVLIDDNLGISKNVVIGGGSYTNGETFLQHVTAPVEFQVTEATQINAGSGKWTITSATATGTGTGPGGSFKPGDKISFVTDGTLAITQPHTHYFKNLPLTLVTDPNAVRTAAASVVNGGSNAASAAAPATHYNSAGGNLTNDPNGPINGVPG